MHLLLPRTFQLLRDGLQEVLRVQIHIFLRVAGSMDTNGQIFRHLARLNAIDARLFQGRRKPCQFRCIVELRPMFETTRPGKDGSNGIGGRWSSLLVFPVERSTTG